jgi:beta-glucosidase
MKINLPFGSPMRSPGFLFGVATSSFQIEGAADKRQPSIWDTFCRTPGKIQDGSDGVIACDHVNRYREDIALMADLGVDAYRFSISWPRVVQPDGSLNAEGCDFYSRLIDGLNENGIRPFATLYHWDLPQYLEDHGGWLNRDTAYRFRDYADAISRVLGDRVYSWATLNEPLCSSYMSYELGEHAPGFRDRGMAKQAAHHQLLAHGLAMPVLHKNCPDALNGIVLNLGPCHSASDREEDLQAAEWADQDLNQWYTQPVLSGGYPALYDQMPDEERPDVIDGDFELICQPLDFLGVNYYTRGIVRAAPSALYEFLPPGDVPLTGMG